MKNQISRWIIFSLIVMVATTITMKATPSNVGSATATVYVHIPLYIDPIVPTTNGNVLPTIIYKTGTPQQVYDADSDPDNPARPFAIFGINGDQNAPVTLTYITTFLHGTGMSCTGKWVLKSTSPSNVTSSTNLTGGILSLNSVNTNLTGISPSLNPAYDNSGGVSLYAYVYTITAADAGTTATGDNQVIFTVTAAYNF
ncbi:MAG: hypothetical protein ACPL1A_06770 [Candidatus Kapaibacteriota bacterium]